MGMAAIDFQLLANAGLPPATFKPGETIFAAGDKGDKMYVIRTGEIEIERDGKVVEKLGPGGIFGEMALIDGAPRAAYRDGQDGLRGRPDYREDVPIPRARHAILRHFGDAHAG